MSLICNTGRPPKDDAFQNLTVNDTLRVNNLVKTTKAEIDRLCSIDAQSASLILGGSMHFEGASEVGLDLFALPSGPSMRSSVIMVPVAVPDLWYTSEELLVRKFQVSAISVGVDTTLNVSIGVTSNPTVATTDVLTVSLPLTSNTVNLVTDVSGTVIIPTGSFVTVHVTSTSTNLTDIRVSWTMDLNP